jgi:hypothetical protein
MPSFATKMRISTLAKLRPSIRRRISGRFGPGTAADDVKSVVAYESLLKPISGE